MIVGAAVCCGRSLELRSLPLSEWGRENVVVNVVAHDPPRIIRARVTTIDTRNPGFSVFTFVSPVSGIPGGRCVRVCAVPCWLLLRV